MREASKRKKIELGKKEKSEQRLLAHKCANTPAFGAGEGGGRGGRGGWKSAQRSAPTAVMRRKKRDVAQVH